MMSRPQLTFFSELKADQLASLYGQQAVLQGLQELGAHVSMGIRDLSDERAHMVRRMNEAGVPLVAWLLLPEDQGYWLNIDNPVQARARYVAFKAWTQKHHLEWTGVGLDIEPDIHELTRLLTQPARALPAMLRRAVSQERRKQLILAHGEYATLVGHIRADGYRVDSYQWPFIVDERRAGSMVLQRLFGVVDVVVDREVLMVYSSFVRPYGPAGVWSYAPDSASVGLGSTGGGVTIGDMSAISPLGWEELRRDLSLATRWTRDIHIFSLEGCVEQGLLGRLKDFESEEAVMPPAYAGEAAWARRALQAVLWSAERPARVAVALMLIWWLIRRMRRKVIGA